MIQKPRRRREGEAGGTAHDGAGMMRWLLTYADMITLLLVFFIVLYSLSKLDAQRFKSLMQALEAALKGQQVATVGKMHQQEKYPPPSPIPSTNEIWLLSRLEAVIRKDHLTGEIRVYPVPQGVMVVILSGVLFPTGSADFERSAFPILRDLGKVLQAVPNVVVVQGFTDSTPIHTAVYHSNWDLSSMRAARVIDFWVNQGLDPHRFLIEGFGQYHPVATNATPQGRAKNRRVDVLVLRNLTLSPTSTLVVGTR
jgi:chemotaxis protein MotB